MSTEAITDLAVLSLCDHIIKQAGLSVGGQGGSVGVLWFI